MLAEIITIGDEILIGQIVDTNSAWLAGQLHQYGIRIHQIQSISDTEKAICEAIDKSSCPLIIITGGLGPTNDDLTKKTLAKYFNSKLVLNEDVLKHIQDLFGARGIEVNELNRQQAFLPDKADILPNSNGTAAGMWFKKGEQNIISLPGVPYEMKGIVTDYLLPQLADLYQLKPVFFKTIMTVGVPESVLAERLSDWENTLPQYVSLAYLPRLGIVRLRLSISGNDYERNRTEVEGLIEDLGRILPYEIYAYEDKSIEACIGDLLTEKGKTVSTAESCTGGNISARLTKIAGSSRYFKGSVIAYSNDIKQNILNVNKSDLEQDGAVSKSVVKQMAMSVRRKMGTDYGIATSGIAGPDGGTPDKPVGTTWIAVATKKQIFANCFQLGNHRERNTERATIFALNMLRLAMLVEDAEA